MLRKILVCAIPVIVATAFILSAGAGTMHTVVAIAKGEGCKDDKGTPIPCTPTKEPPATDTKEPPPPTYTEKPKPTDTKAPTTEPPPSDTPKPTITNAPAGTSTKTAIIPSPTATDTSKPTVLGPTNTITVVPSITTTPSATLIPLIPYFPPTNTPASWSPLIFGDIRVCGIEVTQAIQIYGSGALDNTIPLIATKKTIVRVYAESDTRSAPWTDVTARLTVTGGGTPGRVHLPMTASPSGTIAYLPPGCNRALPQSFNFLLDIDETNVGPRNLSVVIYSISGRVESNTVNNRRTLSISFSPEQYTVLYAFAHGVCDTAGNVVIAPPAWSLIEPQRIFAENTYPVAHFWVLPLPGNPTPCFVTDRMWRADQRANHWAMSALDSLCPAGGCSVFTFNPVIPERGSQTGWCCNYTTRGNQVLNGDTRFGPGSEGAIMAQEFGHKFLGNPHTFDAAYGYPFSNNKIGNQVGVRTYVPGLELRWPIANGDIMSYENDPIWVSPYTYCRLMNIISSGRITCPPGSERANPNNAGIYQEVAYSGSFTALQQTAKTYLFVSGGITPDDLAAFEPFQTFTTPDSLYPVPDRLAGNTYRIAVLNSAGQTLNEYFFATAEGTHNTPGQTAFFDLTIPYDPAIASVRLYRDSTLLAERIASAHAPAVALITQLNGDVSGRQVIAWHGSDEDGDALSYTLEYSRDNGETWITLYGSTTQDHLELDFDSVPGADQAKLRVSVTDGFNTGASESGSFSIARKTPQLSIISPQDGSAFVQGQPFYAEASAWDWEDGPINDLSAYQWSSSVDGTLQSGMWIVPDGLSVGEHTLTIKTRDTDGNAATASIHITITKADAQTDTDQPRGLEVVWQYAIVTGAGILAIVFVLLLLRKRRAR
jgi:hypothetical protein